MTFNSIELPSSHNFDDSFSVDENRLFFPEKNDNVIVFGCAHILRIIDFVVRPVLQANSKGSKRDAARQTVGFPVLA